MALQNITPQLQAEEKTAQFRLHPVPIQNGLAQTGRMLTDAGQGLQKASFGLMLGLKQRNDRLQAEEDDLALASKLNYVTSEATKYAAELNKKTGYEAEGNTQNLDNFINNLLAKGQEGLSPRAARIFGNRVASLRLSLWNSVNGHEFSNTRAASIAEKKNLVKNGLAAFQLTEDPNDLVTALQYQADLYEAQYGARIPDELLGDWGRRRNPETGAFDGDKKNNGWVGIHMNRDGKVVTELSAEYEYDGKKHEVPLLNPYTADNFARIIDGDITDEDKELTRKWGEDRIAEGKSPFYNGDPEDEPLRRLDPSQKALESRLRLFKMEQQNVVDSAVGLLADKYSKNGDLNSLNNLYDAISGEGLPVGDSFLPVSNEAKLQVKQTLDQQFEYQETFYGARGIFDEIKSYDPRSWGGDFYTDKQDQHMWERVNALEASSDPKDHKKAQYIRSWYSDLVRTQQRNLAVATEEWTSGLFESDDLNTVGNDLMVLESYISKLPDNPVRDQLMVLHDKYQKSYNEKIANMATAMTKAEANEMALAEKQRSALEKAWHDDESRKRAVARFKLGFYTNKGEIAFGNGGPRFDLKTERGQKEFIKYATFDGTNGWLFPEDIKYFNEMFSGQISSGAREKAANLIADVLNLSRDDKGWNQYNVNDMMPDLVDDVMREIHTGDNPTAAMPLGGRKEEDIVKQYVSQRLLERATVKHRPSIAWNLLNYTSLIPYGTLYWMFGSASDETTLGEFMNDGIDKKGNLNLEREQRDFDALDRTDEQNMLNSRMRGKLNFGGTAHVETPINFMLWSEEQRKRQTEAVEGAEE